MGAHQTRTSSVQQFKPDPPPRGGAKRGLDGFHFGNNQGTPIGPNNSSGQRTGVIKYNGEKKRENQFSSSKENMSGFSKPGKNLTS